MSGTQRLREVADDARAMVARRVHEDPRVPFIREVLPRHGVGAERGVYRGHFSPLLFAHTDATRLHLIDPWYLLTPRWHWGRGDRSTVNAVRRILWRWRREIDEGRVIVHIADDRAVLRSFDDAYLDWAYIDSSHSRAHTLDELHLLEAKVKPDGVIAGDDWQPDPAHDHHGVYQAVHEFVDDGQYTITYAGETDHQWAIRRADR